MRKKTIIGIFGLVICFMFLPISSIRGALFTLNDATDDISYYDELTLVSQGLNIHPEIDIVSFEIEEDTIVITFDAAPVIDDDHLYEFKIFWTGDDSIGNWTEGYLFGSANHVTTRIENSTGGAIISDQQTFVIDTDGLTIIAPLYHVGYITNMSDPHMVNVYSSVYVDVHDYYHDELLFYTAGFPGLTFWIATVGISTLVMLGSIITRKKN